MEDQVIDSLSPELKKWFAKAIVGMIYADGKVDDSEIDYLKEMVSFLKDKKLIRHLLNLAKQKKVPLLEPMAIEEVQAKAIIKQLTYLSIVDEELDGTEENFLFYVSRQLGQSDEIPKKFVSLARKRLKGKKLRAKLTISNNSLDVTCFSLSVNECLFFSNHSITPMIGLTLEFYKRQKSQTNKETFQAISANVARCRMIDSLEGNYIVKAVFKHTIHDIHGTKMFFSVCEDDEPKKEPTISSSLSGFYVKCYICGEKNIMFWQLGKNNARPKKNIFGVPTYNNTNDDENFCNFNLMQVTVCPNCFFASNRLDYFQIQGKKAGKLPIASSGFETEWQKTVYYRKELINEINEGFFTERRTKTEAILSYQLAIETEDYLSRFDPDRSTFKLNTIFLILTQAELAMENGLRAIAERKLQEVKNRLETVFTNLKKTEKIQVASLLIMIKIYFKNYEHIEIYQDFLKNYPSRKALDPESEESKSLSQAIKMTTEAWKHRDKYVYEKLGGFLLKD